MKNTIEATFNEIFTSRNIPAGAQPYVYAEAMMAIKEALGLPQRPIPYPPKVTESEKSYLGFIALTGLFELTSEAIAEAATGDIFHCIAELAKESMDRFCGVQPC